MLPNTNLPSSDSAEIKSLISTKNSSHLSRTLLFLTRD
jgi:hypothetical protein